MSKKLTLLSLIALGLLAAAPAVTKTAKPVRPGKAVQPAAAKPADATPADADEPLRIATAYLNALEGSGPEYSRTYLLGKVTLDATVVAIANWKIVERQPVQVEKGSLKDAIAAMRKLDKLGSDYLTKKYKLKSAAEISREQAREVLAPTAAETAAFVAKHPLFAEMARADKWVYWNPDNPWRTLLPELGNHGDYTLSYHRFTVEEVGKRSSIRQWPLRVLRIQTDAYDSGWKILPASSWDPSV